MLASLLTPDERAAVERLRKHEYGQRDGGTHMKLTDFKITALAFIRLLDSIPAEPLYTIPGLKWEPWNGGSKAYSLMREYVCGSDEPDNYWFVGPVMRSEGSNFPSLLAAQQAAESDYRERMVKGLTEWKPGEKQ